MKIYLRVLLIFIRIIIIIIPCTVLLWLVYKDLVVSGQLRAKYNFHDRSPFITVLRPQSRIEPPQHEKGVWFQQIKDQPVYFDVRLPRSFDMAKVSMVFQNIDQPIIELGALADKDREI